MTSKEFNSYLSTRGSTLCLGLNSHISVSLLLKILGIDGQIKVNGDRLLLLFNNFEETIQESIYVNGEKWEMVCNIKSDILRSAIVLLPWEILNTDIFESDTSKKLGIDKWNINNVWLFDIFPYQTQLGTMTLTKIRDWCKEMGYGLGIGLVTGYNQYGSTDISSERDAINSEMEYLKRESIPVMIVDKRLSINQAFEMQNLSEDRLTQAMNKLAEEKKHTLDNLEIVRELLGFLIANKVGASVSDTRKSVQNALREVLVDLFPVGKYLDEKFYEEYEKAITIYFKTKKDSDIYKINKKCTDALCSALEYWINKYNRI